MTLQERLSESHRIAMVEFANQRDAVVDKIMKEVIDDIFTQQHQANKYSAQLKFSVATTGTDVFKVFDSGLFEDKTFSYSVYGLKEEISENMRVSIWAHISEKAKKEGIKVDPLTNGIYIFSLNLEES